MISRTAIRGATILCNAARSGLPETRTPSLTFARRLTQSRALLQDEKAVVGAKAEADPTLTETQAAAQGYGPGFHHHPSNWDKKLLVWTNIYKNADEIPETISTTQMKRGRDVFRIRMNIVMLIATIMGCVWMIKSGRRAMESGQNLSNDNREWHRRNREEFQAQKAKANASNGGSS